MTANGKNYVQVKRLLKVMYALERYVKDTIRECFNKNMHQHINDLVHDLRLFFFF